MSSPLLLTLGDPVGIGPEIVWKAHRAGALRDAVVVGSPAVLRRARASLGEVAAEAAGLAVLTELDEAEASPPGALRVWNPSRAGGQLSDPDGLDRLPWGQADARAGAAAARWVEAAAQAVRAGQGRALVTAPLNKAALSAAGVPFPGHTELLQHQCRDAQDRLPPVRMMLANPELRVVLVTIHLALREAIEALNREAVLQTLRITDAALRREGVVDPRVGVAGLNPHAGEGGLFGREEIEVIGPAIAAARAEGIDADGPHPPDTVFMRARSTPARPGAFDAVVAMTHDHGLIPVKYLGVEQGVNVTLGLPLVRTSPDHGTAFDIAGQGRADPSSLLAALAMARRMAPLPA